MGAVKAGFNAAHVIFEGKDPVIVRSKLKPVFCADFPDVELPAPGPAPESVDVGLEQIVVLLRVVSEGREARPLPS